MTVVDMGARLAEIEAEQAELMERNKLVIELSDGGWMNRTNEARYQRHCERMDVLNAEWRDVTQQIHLAGLAADDGA